MKTENINKARKENTKTAVTENSEKMQRQVKEKNIVDKIVTGSSAGEPDVIPKVREMSAAIEIYCFVLDTSFKDVEDECELETGAVLSEMVNLALSDPPYSTHSARSHSNLAQDVFWTRDVRNAATLANSVIDTGEHGHVICSDLVFYYWNRAL